MKKKIISVISVVCILAQSAVLATNNDGNYDTFYQKHGYNKSASVFINFKEVTFDDVFPLVENGTTFVPARVVTESLGGEIEYIASTDSVVITLNENEISFVIGSKDVVVNGEEITLLSNTFKLDNRTMIPLRLVSETFGYDVYWVHDEKAVSIVDSSILKDKIEEDYTLINGVLNMANSEIQTGKNMMINGEFEASSGSSQLMNAAFTALADSDLKALNIDFEGSLGLVAKMLAADTNDEFEKAFYLSLEEFSGEAIVDLNSLDVYACSNVLASLFKSQGVTDGTWVKTKISNVFGYDLAELIEAYQENYTATLSDLIDVKILELNETIKTNSENCFEELAENLELLKDENFTKNGDVYEATFYDVTVEIQTNSNVIKSYEISAKDNSFVFGQKENYNVYLVITSGIVDYTFELNFAQTSESPITKPTSTDILDI